MLGSSTGKQPFWGRMLASSGKFQALIAKPSRLSLLPSQDRANSCKVSKLASGARMGTLGLFMSCGEIGIILELWP